MDPLSPQTFIGAIVVMVVGTLIVEVIKKVIPQLQFLQIVQKVFIGVLVTVIGGWIIQRYVQKPVSPPPPETNKSESEMLQPVGPRPKPSRQIKKTLGPLKRHSLPPRKPHETQAPWPIQIGDFSMAMKQCIWTEKYQLYHAVCEGAMENKSDTKLDVKFDSGRFIDDKGNEYALSNGQFLLGMTWLQNSRRVAFA